MFILDDAKEVDVGVVDGEVDGHKSGPPGDPKPLLELLDDGQGLVLEGVQVLDGAGTTVGLQDAGVVGPAKVPSGLVPPSRLDRESLIMCDAFSD